MGQRAVSIAVIATAFAIAGATARPAGAGGLDLDLTGPRAIGRAGAVTVSEDGGLALFINPGGLTRRSELRLQIATTLHDDDSRYHDPATPDSPTIINRARSQAAPMLAVLGSLGPVIAGVAYLETGSVDRSLPSPEFNQPTDDVVTLFPHRYGGSQVGFHRHTFAAGGAVRASSWLGFGVSLHWSTVALSESRRIWSGFADRDGPIGNPSRDLDLELGGDDLLVPGAAIGILVAPPQLPMEIALAASASQTAKLEGDASLRSTRAVDYPAPQVASTNAVTASLVWPIVLRAGLRYLGDRLFAEVGSELYIHAGDAPRWQLDGVTVVDDTGLVAVLAEVDSLIDQRDHFAVRAAADVEVVRGFLWLSLGYARRTGASFRDRLTPGYFDLGGTTLAAGAEGQWSGITCTIGYARSLTSAVTTEQSSRFLFNPFAGGTESIGAGEYRQAHDSFGIALEIAWE